jgi:hypothetical protein
MSQDELVDFETEVVLEEEDDLHAQQEVMEGKGSLTISTHLLQLHSHALHHLVGRILEPLLGQESHCRPHHQRLEGELDALVCEGLEDFMDKVAHLLIIVELDEPANVVVALNDRELADLICLA